MNIVYGFLSIENGHFVYNKEKIFLSGVNIAWDHYARFERKFSKFHRH